MTSSTFGRAPRVALIGVLVALLGAVGLIAASSGRAAAPSCKAYDTLRLGYQPVTTYQPPLVAASQGIMKKYCIKLETVPIASPAVSLAQIAAGRQELGLVSTSILVTSIQAGVQVKAIAPNSNANKDFPFYVKKDGPIKTWKDFEGKIVASAGLGSTVDIAERTILARKGVDLNKVRFTQLPAQNLTSALLDGTIQACGCQEPFATQNIDKLTMLMESPNEEVYGRHAAGTYTVAATGWIGSHKDLVTRYQKAILEMALRLQKSQTGFRRILGKLNNIDDATAQKMRLFTVATDYNMPSVLKTLKQAVRFGILKDPVSETELKKMYVPLPKLPPKGKTSF